VIWAVIPEQLVTNAFLELLRSGGLAVYDHTVPPAARRPYCMVSSIPGGGWSGPPLMGGQDDASLVYQVDYVAARRDQAQLYRDKGDAVVVGRTDGGLDFEFPYVEGWACCDRIRTDAPGGVEVEGAPPNAVYTAVRRYTITMTPSNEGGH
jgi:hypothetical protein